MRIGGVGDPHRAVIDYTIDWPQERVYTTWKAMEGGM
jgi:hypothetical protein